MKDFILNLQLFAEMNTNVIHTGRDEQGKLVLNADLAPENKEYYDKLLIDMAGPELVHDQFAQKRNIPAGNGTRITFRRFIPLPKATQPLEEGKTPDGKKLAVTEIGAEVSQYGDYIVQSDMLELTSIDNTIVEATKILGRQAGLTLDTITRDAMHNTSNDWYVPKSDGTEVDDDAELDDTCILSVDQIMQISAFLQNCNAPKINGDYVCILHPYCAYDIMKDPAWQAPHTYKDTTELYNGELGKIAGVRFVVSSEAKVSANGVFYPLFMGEGAYGTTEITGGGLETIVKQKGSSGVADALNQRSSVGWKAIKTAEVLVHEYLVRVHCKSGLSHKIDKAN